MTQPLRLTLTQHQIVTLLASGWHTKKIARHLNVEVATINAHIKQINDRVGTASRYQLMAWYGQRGAIVEDLRGKTTRNVA